MRIALAEVDVRRRLRVGELRIEKAGLQADDVVAELVVLGLDGLVVLGKGFVLADLILQ